MRRRRFNIKAGESWMVDLYKGKPRVIMHRAFGRIRQPITPYDVLRPSRVKDLVAWLNRYLADVSPTNKSLAIAGIRANANGVKRNLSELEAAL